MNVCELLDDYIDGDLSGDQADRFRQHIVTCERCQRELESQADFQRLVGIAADAFHQTYRDRYAQVAMVLRRKQATRRAFTAACAIAASIAIIWTVVFVTRPSQPPDTSAESDLMTEASERANDKSTISQTDIRRARITLSADTEFLAEPIETSNSNITIYWLHPTNETDGLTDSSLVPAANDTLLARRT